MGVLVSTVLQFFLLIPSGTEEIDVIRSRYFIYSYRTIRILRNEN
jgi:hypothetical protein